MLERLKSRDAWLTFLLPLLLVLLAAVTLGQAELVIGVDLQTILLVTGALGFVAGATLGISRFPALTASTYGLVYGLFALGVIIGRTYPAEIAWRERVADMVVRQSIWIGKAINGGTSRDALIFVMHTGALLWLIGYTAGWYTYRKPRLWRVILPGGLLLLSVVYYYYGTRPLLYYLAAYSLVALLTIAHTHLTAIQQEWRYRAVRYESSITGQFLRSGLTLALVALIVVAQLPALTASAAVSEAVSRVDEPWQRFRDNWQRLFSTLTAPSAVVSDYSDRLTLGGPRNVNDAPIMDVYVAEQLPYAYWRASVLDAYEDGEWRLAPGETVELYPDDPPLPQALGRGRRTVTQTFVNYIPNAGTVYAAPDFVSADRPLWVKVETLPGGNQLVVGVRSRFVLQLGDRYEVASSFSEIDENSLRRSSVAYPAYIRERYLAVPRSVTARTAALAAEITAPYDNPYDKALAIQDYLRVNMTYNDQIPGAPPGAEPIDYFLFEFPEGYCNYYASAMAIMLRTQGVPTRLGRGYAAGEYNAEDGVYRVRARDAHTWPEVYFEGFGWLPFEPTATFDTVARPSGAPGDGPLPTPTPRPQPTRTDDAFQMDDPQDLIEGDPRGGTTAQQTPEPTWAERINWGQLLLATGAVALGATAVWGAQRYNRSVESSLEGSYGRLLWWARRLGVPVRPTQTPHEQAYLLADAAPDGRGPIMRLFGELVRTRYSPRKERSPFFHPLVEWRTLRPILRRTWRRRIVRRLRRKL